ncbi:hypothetical protein CCR75_006743 [Bremia lactucae]|uniref:Uncharacterized protein n=1 Tax=Bremia lactucae TaxID=4779 RepID=A0A976FKN2_BRELC|nr:hypothetical protein CCR75_006743 [Bremia lactucae]
MASVLPSKPQVGKGGAWEDEAAQPECYGIAHDMNEQDKGIAAGRRGPQLGCWAIGLFAPHLLAASLATTDSRHISLYLKEPIGKCL